MEHRFLSAVMFTDIVGFSALASRNEEEALQLVEINRNHQKPIIEKYGIFIKEMGDGVLARFPSAYDAVRCALDIQQLCPAVLKDKIRIGLHLGDVSENQGDIFGDGVNVASRLESKARPGTIYLSDSVHNAIKGRGEITTKYVGTFRLKNLKDPVRTYTLADKEQNSIRDWISKSGILKFVLKLALVFLAASLLVELVAFLVAKNNMDSGIIDLAILLLLFVVVGYFLYSSIKVGRLKLFLIEMLNILVALTTMGFYILNPLDLNPEALRIFSFDYDKSDDAPTVRSLVVLPFYNDIGEDQEFLVAGIQDGLINEIGKLGSMRVISRTSTLSYASAEKPMKEIAKELHVEMVVEGALIRIDSSLELNVKLVNPFPEEKLVWSDSYQFSLGEVQKLFHEVTRNVALKVNQVLLPMEEKMLASSTEINPEAYQSLLMGKYYLGYMTTDGLSTAEKYFQEAVEIDSTYAPAITGLAMVWMSRRQMGFNAPREANPIIDNYLEEAFRYDPDAADVWTARAAMSVWGAYDFETGEQEFRKSIKLNPNISGTRAGYAHLLMILNRWDEAWEQMNYALKIDPLNPLVIAFSGIMYSFEGKLLSATKQFETITDLEPDQAMANAYLLQKYTRTFQHRKALEELKKFVSERHLSGYEKLIDDTYSKNGFEAAIRATAESLGALSKTQFVPAAMVAMLYKLIGDKEGRLRWIEEMYRQHHPGLPYLAIRVDDPIQQEPRYIAVMEKAGLW